VFRCRVDRWQQVIWVCGCARFWHGVIRSGEFLVGSGWGGSVDGGRGRLDEVEDLLHASSRHPDWLTDGALTD
jgi:hypothetical protein